MCQKIRKKKSSKKSFLLLVLATFVLPVWGGQVDENTARQVASQTLSRSSVTHNTDSTTQLRAKSVSQGTLQLLYKSSSADNSGNTNSSMRAARANANETVYFYVFGAEDGNGFVIVAGDDRVTPVLGYSDTNGFSADDMPDNLKWWLNGYAQQIKFAIDNDIVPTQETKQQWKQYLEPEKLNKYEKDIIFSSDVYNDFRCKCKSANLANRLSYCFQCNCHTQ